jgi:predicted flap endonuclease-1-like 5' DNA nuclease
LGGLEVSYRIDEIEGIGPANRAKLEKAGITTTDKLLKLCADKKGREEVAAGTGLQAKQLLVWANMADLMRIKGIGRQFSEVLKASGVDTVKELRNRRADNLAAKMGEVNAVKKLAKASPSKDIVQGWIDLAKELPPLISH